MSHISDPQDCSLGRLIWPLNESDRIDGGGSMVVVEHTFFLMKSCAMAVLCWYTLVSFTMMKEIRIIILIISGCV